MPGHFYLSPFPILKFFGATQIFSTDIYFKMPKDKKRPAKNDSESESDSGPEDRGPAKSPVKKSAKSGYGSAPIPGSADALADGSGEPSWSLGNMKFAKVSLVVIKKKYFRFL